MQAATTTALHSLMFSTQPFEKEGESSLYEEQRMEMHTVGTYNFHGQWGPRPIPKFIPFTYWNSKWEVKVSTHAFMGWGLFTLEVTKVGDELLPFVGQWFSKTKFKNLDKTTFVK